MLRPSSCYWTALVAAEWQLSTSSLNWDNSCEDKLKTNANPRVQIFDDFVDILVFLRRNIESHYENLSTVLRPWSIQFFCQSDHESMAKSRISRRGYEQDGKDHKIPQVNGKGLHVFSVSLQ